MLRTMYHYHWQHCGSQTWSMNGTAVLGTTGHCVRGPDLQLYMVGCCFQKHAAPEPDLQKLKLIPAGLKQ